jgi:phosphoribosylformylglycinamidine synthase
LVGPWQVPVSDLAITASSYEGITGEAMAMGERTPLAALNAPASGRMAVAEAVTNIAAARIGELQQVRLSANWMAAAGHPGEDANLFDTVKAVSDELCRDLGIAIPVGKDSLSMRARWQDEQGEHQVVAPVSLRRADLPAVARSWRGQESAGRILPGPGVFTDGRRDARSRQSGPFEELFCSDSGTQ